MDEETEKPRILYIIGLAFMCAVGVLIEVLASVFWGGWWLIFVVLGYALIPLPNLLCKRIGGDPFSTGIISSTYKYRSIAGRPPVLLDYSLLLLIFSSKYI